MRYEIERASGKDFNINWGNFCRKEYFEKDSFIFNLKELTGYFNATKKTFSREGKVVKYAYGHYGTTPKEIFEKCLRSFLNDGRVIRHIDSETFQLGRYRYFIDIDSLDDLKKIMKQFNERLIISDKWIVIYDDYVE